VTRAPRRSPLAFRHLDDVAEAIREQGGRLTAARRIVLAALFAAEGPVSAEHIADGLGGRMVSSDVSSVYRNLERLEELGAVRHVHVGHGPGLYVLEDDTDREYLVCERCDRVDTVEAECLDPVRAEIERTFGYQARFSHFPVVGLCRRCAKLESVEQDTGEDLAHAHGDRVHTHRHAGRHSH